MPDSTSTPANIQTGHHTTASPIPTRTHGGLRRRRVAALTTAFAAAVGVLLAGPVAPAGAAPSGDDPVDQYVHQNDHPMGSQIKKHDGGQTSDVQSFLASVQTPGLDVSGWQGNVDWNSVAANGGQFAYVKATEGTGYTNPYFSQQYEGSYYAGLIRGSYHFARPDVSAGWQQADYFVDHGGGWSADGKTLPGALDIEWNPYGSACYGYSAAGMVDWILSFSNEYQYRTGRWPVIYTANSWWTQCTGNQGDFSSTNPLWVASYSSTPGTLPYAWGYETIWQFADSGVFPGDQDRFNGDITRVQALANG